MSPTSSRNRVPLWANSNRPISCPNAPVTSLVSDSSLSRSPVGMAAQFKVMKGKFLRGLILRMARATNSFPVPVSPKIGSGDRHPRAKSARQDGKRSRGPAARVLSVRVPGANSQLVAETPSRFPPFPVDPGSRRPGEHVRACPANSGKPRMAVRPLLSSARRIFCMILRGRVTPACAIHRRYSASQVQV